MLRAAPHLCSLAQHAFGNYLVSKLASLPLLRPALAAAFRGHMASLLCHAQGSRVVQAFLAAAAPAEAEALVSELDGRVVECALDTHGSWGVCVAYSATRAPFVLRELFAAVVRLSLEQHGSRVVQYTSSRRRATRASTARRRSTASSAAGSRSSPSTASQTTPSRWRCGSAAPASAT